MTQRRLRPSQGGKFNRPVGKPVPERWELVPGDVVRIMPNAQRLNAPYKHVTSGIVQERKTIHGSNPERVPVLLHKHESGGSYTAVLDRDSLRLIPPAPVAPKEIVREMMIGGKAQELRAARRALGLDQEVKDQHAGTAQATSPFVFTADSGGDGHG